MLQVWARTAGVTSAGAGAVACTRGDTGGTGSPCSPNTAPMTANYMGVLLKHPWCVRSWDRIGQDSGKENVMEWKGKFNDERTQGTKFNGEEITQDSGVSVSDETNWE